MKYLTLLLVTCVSATIALTPLGEIILPRGDHQAASHLHKRHNTPNPWQNGTCNVDPQGFTFKNWVGDLTVTGGFHGNSTSNQFISLDIDNDGASVLQFSADITPAGVVCNKWHFGDMIGVVQDIVFTTVGNLTNGTVNGREITPFSPGSSNLTFTDGTPVPTPDIPDPLLLALSSVSEVVRGTISNCQASDVDSMASHFPRQQAPIGFPGGFDDTGHATSCVVCLAEATAASVACGLACGFSFGLACGCVAAVPFIFAQCHNPGTGLGQGCCPVACGPSQTELGVVSVTFSCCSDGDSCLSPSTGRCCASGLQPCGGNICCPSNAPCRDPGICCPTNRNTCITPGGPTCCNVGEECVQGQCCQSGLVRNGTCCSPDVCCVPGSESRCFADGFQTCVNGQWAFTRCQPPQFCLGIPVAGAGVFCIGVGLHGH